MRNNSGFLSLESLLNRDPHPNVIQPMYLHQIELSWDSRMLLLHPKHVLKASCWLSSLCMLFRANDTPGVFVIF